MSSESAKGTAYRLVFGARPNIGDPRRNQTSSKERCVELIVAVIAFGDEDAAHRVANPRETFFVRTKVPRVLLEGRGKGKFLEKPRRRPECKTACGVCHRVGGE